MSAAPKLRCQLLTLFESPVICKRTHRFPEIVAVPAVNFATRKAGAIKQNLRSNENGIEPLVL